MKIGNPVKQEGVLRVRNLLCLLVDFLIQKKDFQKLVCNLRIVLILNSSQDTIMVVQVMYASSWLNCFIRDKGEGQDVNLQL